MFVGLTYNIATMGEIIIFVKLKYVTRFLVLTNKQFEQDGFIYDDPSASFMMILVD